MPDLQQMSSWKSKGEEMTPPMFECSFLFKICRPSPTAPKRGSKSKATDSGNGAQATEPFSLILCLREATFSVRTAINSVGSVVRSGQSTPSEGSVTQREYSASGSSPVSSPLKFIWHWFFHSWMTILLSVPPPNATSASSTSSTSACSPLIRRGHYISTTITKFAA